MLENDYQQQFDLLLGMLKPSVTVPEAWTGYFDRQGMLPALHNDQRRFARRYLRTEAVCEMKKSLPSIERRHEFSKVFVKDYSRGGVAFLVGHQLYPGEALSLWTNSGKLLCSVVRCIKHNGQCFEIGATFEKTP